MDPFAPWNTTAGQGLHFHTKRASSSLSMPCSWFFASLWHWTGGRLGIRFRSLATKLHCPDCKCTADRTKSPLPPISKPDRRAMEDFPTLKLDSHFLRWNYIFFRSPLARSKLGFAVKNPLIIIRERVCQKALEENGRDTIWWPEGLLFFTLLCCSCQPQPCSKQLLFLSLGC